jgi:hypothetical protein
MVYKYQDTKHFLHFAFTSLLSITYLIFPTISDYFLLFPLSMTQGARPIFALIYRPDIINLCY